MHRGRPMHPISQSIKRFDFDEKIDGQARYCADMKLEDMVYARTLRSTRMRARILSIQVPALPEGYYIVDRNDIPGKNSVPIVYDDEPFLARDVVNYVGEPILLVVGPDKEVILDLLVMIQITYQDLEPIRNMEDARQCHENYIFNNQSHFVKYEYTKGDLAAAISEAKSCIEDEYRTGYQEHVYMETQSIIAVFDGQRITVQGSMQCPYYIKDALVQALDWDEERIRVIQLPTGGGFGGKEDYPSIVAVHAALAAIKAQKPVQLVLDRDEDIRYTTKRHPAVITIKSYLDAGNRIIARDVKIDTDAGAYAGLSSVVLQRMMFSVCGVYRIDHLRVQGRALATNNIVSGAFRGFGGPQAFFAIEMHMEHIAQVLQMDSLQLKRQYFLRQGDTSSTGGVFHYDIKLDEIINRIDALSHYQEKRREPDSGGVRLKGIGCSLFFHGCGFTGKAEKDLLKSRVVVKKHADDDVEILVSNTEIGQGCATTLRKIVAHALEIPTHCVSYSYPDTDFCPDSGPTIASRTVMIVGKLLYDCALDIKAAWDSKQVECSKEFAYPPNLFWNNTTFEGNAYAEYAWGSNVVEVEVDPLTGGIEVLGAWAVYDIGTPIDEKIVKGQIDGGMTQGLGYGSMEIMSVRDGRILQGSLADYIIPTALDFPEIISDLIDNPYPNGPAGARGLGELSLIGAAPALALAVQNAIGKPVTQIPVTPEYLLELMYDE